LAENAQKIFIEKFKPEFHITKLITLFEEILQSKK
jgi:hypothetical protein